MESTKQRCRATETSSFDTGAGRRSGPPAPCQGAPPYKLALQAGDANLVHLWNQWLRLGSGPPHRGAPFKLIMQDDGNLVIYDSAHRFIWDSGSAQ